MKLNADANGCVLKIWTVDCCLNLRESGNCDPTVKLFLLLSGFHDTKIKEKWIHSTHRGPNWWPLKRNTICSALFAEKILFQVLFK